uniref:Uncharacterized protein n=1 Tax=Arundo donax TaxID=35708 RepID=A0A0A8YWD4_ARUDO
MFYDYKEKAELLGDFEIFKQKGSVLPWQNLYTIIGNIFSAFFYYQRSSYQLIL